jgi:hypothetical protein
MSEYGGRDDTAFGEKFNKFMNHFNPFSMAVSGDVKDKYDELLKEFENRNPDGYNEYMRAERKHKETIKKASISGRNAMITDQHKPLVSGLKDIIWETLKKNAKLLKEGKEPILSKEQVDKYYAIRNDTGDMSYSDLSRLTYDFNEDVGNRLDKETKSDMVAWEIKEQNQLSSKGFGDVDLGIATDLDTQTAIQDEKDEEKYQLEEYEKEEKQIKQDTIDRDLVIKQEAIDKENEEVIKTRGDVTHNGFVNTSNNDIPQLRPKIVFGNTDLKYFQSEEEVRQERETIDKMLMWKAKNITEQNDPTNILYKKSQANERKRFQETFRMPDVPKGFEPIPQSFLRFNQRAWVPVFAEKSESLPLMANPRRNQAPFTKPEPFRDDSSSMIEEIKNRPIVFPEPVLQGYKGKQILNQTKGFNPWLNSRMIR